MAKFKGSLFQITAKPVFFLCYTYFLFYYGSYIIVVMVVPAVQSVIRTVSIVCLAVTGRLGLGYDGFPFSEECNLTSFLHTPACAYAERVSRRLGYGSKKVNLFAVTKLIKQVYAH